MEDHEYDSTSDQMSLQRSPSVENSNNKITDANNNYMVYQQYNISCPVL